MGCGSSNTVSPDRGGSSKAKQEVIENYHRRRSSSGEDNFSVTQHLIKSSRPGNKGILSPPPIESTGSQLDFFRMLDAKVEQGGAFSQHRQQSRLSKQTSRCDSVSETSRN